MSLEDDFVDGVQDAAVVLHKHTKEINRGARVLEQLKTTICPENGISDLTVKDSGKSLLITSAHFPGECFVVRATLAGMEFIRRNELRHEDEVMFSTDFENENIFGFMKKLGRHLRFIDAGYEPA